MTQNPFIQSFEGASYSTRDQAIPFDQIRVEHYLPAFEQGIQLAKQNVERIKTLPASFQNTILGLETSSELLDQVSETYFNLFSAEANEAHQALAKEISPKLAAFQSDVSLDPGLFAKIKEVYENRQTLGLKGEDLKLTEKFFKDFSRNGALLSESDKLKLRQIDQDLSVLGPQFSENVLKATNAFEIVISDRKDLLGLPDGAVEAASLEAQKKGHIEKWIFNLQAPSYLPLMQYAQNRELRKKMWMAYNSRTFRDSYDNQEQVKNIVRLRQERASLLGAETHADFVLAERMAKTPASVMSFLNALLVPSKKAAEKDLAELRAFKKSIDGVEEVMPWDFAYYSEKLKEKKYAFNEEELRPYFQLEKVIDGVFEHARRLYLLTFKQIFDVPTYHEDVKVFEVREEGTQKYVGLFYMDFFPRETKKGGAWMTQFRSQGMFVGQVRRPHVSIVCNFTKPTPSKPSLLSYDEVQTLFHEFGHALHGLLSQCQYRTLSGPNVYWDFVELPSQIMENWVKEKEGLDLFAKHYQTGETLPSVLVEKLKRADKFQTGYYSLRQLSFAMLDMSWHSLKPGDLQQLDVDQFETTALAGTRLLPKVPGTNVSVSFSHVFNGGYSAGYYSYKWAEVLDADAFEFFKEKGLFNREVADLFKDNILSRGGTEHPMDLYKKFRGREPDPEALLRRDGLLNL
jgi:peptidyl-dipeptidase Dcp